MRLLVALAITVASTSAALVRQASAQGAGDSNQALVGTPQGAWPNGLVVVLTGIAVAKLRRVPVSRPMAVSPGAPVVDPGRVASPSQRALTLGGGRSSSRGERPSSARTLAPATSGAKALEGELRNPSAMLS